MAKRSVQVFKDSGVGSYFNTPGNFGFYCIILSIDFRSYFFIFHSQRTIKLETNTLGTVLINNNAIFIFFSDCESVRIDGERGGED
jgi:hypothetical protein